MDGSTVCVLCVLAFNLVVSLNHMVPIQCGLCIFLPFQEISHTQNVLKYYIHGTIISQIEQIIMIQCKITKYKEMESTHAHCMERL